jgi:hypothetical protein
MQVEKQDDQTEYDVISTIIKIDAILAFIRKDYDSAKKYAKILSNYNRKNPELKKLYITLFGE